MKSILFVLIIGIVVIFSHEFFTTDPEKENTQSVASNFAVGSISESIKELFQKDIAEKIHQNIVQVEPLKRFLDDQSSSSGELTIAGTVQATNAERVKSGLSPLVYNAKLEAAAQAKVNDMFTRQYFAHDAPTGEGPSDLATDAGYAFVIVGENLALGHFVDDVDLVTAWMNSPGHRENIMSTSYTEIGVAVGKGMYEGQEVWLAVQEFGTPLSACNAPEDGTKAALDTQKKQLDNMDAELSKLKAEIEEQKNALPPEEYNKKVNIYNAKVAEYNILLERSKKAMAAYNVEVTAFNECVGKYTK